MSGILSPHRTDGSPPPLGIPARGDLTGPATYRCNLISSALPSTELRPAIGLWIQAEPQPGSIGELPPPGLVSARVVTTEPVGEGPICGTLKVQLARMIVRAHPT